MFTRLAAVIHALHDISHFLTLAAIRVINEENPRMRSAEMGTLTD